MIGIFGVFIGTENRARTIVGDNRYRGIASAAAPVSGLRARPYRMEGVRCDDYQRFRVRRAVRGAARWRLGTDLPHGQSRRADGCDLRQRRPSDFAEELPELSPAWPNRSVLDVELQRSAAVGQAN